MRILARLSVVVSMFHAGARGRIVALDPPCPRAGTSGRRSGFHAARRRCRSTRHSVRCAGSDRAGGLGGRRGGRGRFGRIVRRARRRRQQASSRQARAPDGCVQGFHRPAASRTLPNTLVLSMVPLKIFAPAPPANSMTSPPPWVSAPGFLATPTSQEVVVKGIDVAQIVARGAAPARSRPPCCRLPGWSASAFGRPPLPNTSVV